MIIIIINNQQYDKHTYIMCIYIIYLIHILYYIILYYITYIYYYIYYIIYLIHIILYYIILYYIIYIIHIYIHIKKTRGASQCNPGGVESQYSSLAQGERTTCSALKFKPRLCDCKPRDCRPWC